MPLAYRRRGSLLCTTSTAATGQSGRRTLSCNFNGMAGGDSGLSGHILLKGGAALPSGRHVLMWSVLAPTTDVEASTLVGNYRETSPGRLVGGRGGTIVLTPATGTARTRDAALTLLELGWIRSKPRRKVELARPPNARLPSRRMMRHHCAIKWPLSPEPRQDWVGRRRSP
jgi:Protein of unknown function (DUF992)